MLDETTPEIRVNIRVFDSKFYPLGYYILRGNCYSYGPPPYYGVGGCWHIQMGNGGGIYYDTIEECDNIVTNNGFILESRCKPVGKGLYAIEEELRASRQGTGTNP